MSGSPSCSPENHAKSDGYPKVRDAPAPLMDKGNFRSVPHLDDPPNGNAAPGANGDGAYEEVIYQVTGTPYIIGIDIGNGVAFYVSAAAARLALLAGGS